MKSSLVQIKKIWGRVFIYPKKPAGVWHQRRVVVAVLLLLGLFLFPHLKMNGEQLVLLNFIERKFVFFGLIFTPQDFHLFALAMLFGMIFIVCFTVIFGRLWCGWACPQTIFMEMIFRKIEYWIEGDAQKQKKLDAQPWDFEKISKKGSKHLLFLLISFAIANTFLAYIIGSEQLFQIISEPLQSHWVGFASIILFTLIFYLVFAYVREVVCTVICPYGRLQGVLLDNKSLVVAYDVNRGEPRGPKLRVEDPLNVKGDCVDCGLCVQVCPTGIDIREGTQLECVNCTACIDSCNQVMQKLNRAENLIGFHTQEYIKYKKPFVLSMKAYGYAAILLVVAIVFSSLIYKREEVETTVLRASGTLYQIKGDSISNLYTVQLINKTNRDITFKMASENKQDSIFFIQAPSILKRESELSLTFFLYKKTSQLNSFKSEVKFKVQSEGKLISTAKSTFFAPNN
ncbi:MAG: cytochrome c oxidase accessory protein CcoG [Pedobacter sp.]|nr:MAG: cytochrome c oxidase accessory protein CcoG [Pedobacter sp.]